MGLFYGASVISLFEMILMLFKAIWALVSQSRAAYLKEKAGQEASALVSTVQLKNLFSITYYKLLIVKEFSYFRWKENCALKRL